MHLNLAAYRFTPLVDLPALRTRLLAAGGENDVRGTILIAPEGINLVVSAPPRGARILLDALAQAPGLENLPVRESLSDGHSFARFLVKIKREIIAFRQPACDPGSRRGARIDPVTFARWLDQGADDQGRPLALVDTRNAFEVEVGRFAGAIDPGIASFGALPDALQARRDTLAGHRIVTYCTGGIRCEKAVLWMDDHGFEDVVQLEGGVLGYFAAVGSRHWEGDLFVFDRRVALTPALAPARWEQVPGSRAVRQRDEDHVADAGNPPRRIAA